MAGNHVTFVAHPGALDLVRRLPLLEKELKRRADNLADACNKDFVISHEAHDPEWVRGDSKEGYRVGKWQGKSRVRLSVITATQHAINDNKRDFTILRNVGALYH